MRPAALLLLGTISVSAAQSLPSQVWLWDQPDNVLEVRWGDEQNSSFMHCNGNRLVMKKELRYWNDPQPHPFTMTGVAFTVRFTDDRITVVFTPKPAAQPVPANEFHVNCQGGQLNLAAGTDVEVMKNAPRKSK